MKKSIYEVASRRIDDMFDSWDRGIHQDSIEIIEEALEQAQKQEQEHIEYSKKVQEQFSNDTKRIGELESKLIRQEKLLELYREKDKYTTLDTPLPDVELLKYTNTVKQIKELEND